MSIKTGHPTRSIKRVASKTAVHKPTQEQQDAAELAECAKLVFDLNKEMNAAKKRYDIVREDLLRKMAEKGIKQFTVSGFGNTPSLVAEIKAPTREVVDVEQLAKMLHIEQFVKCVTASKETVAKVAGKAVAMRCLTLATGTENVTVKPL